MSRISNTPFIPGEIPLDPSPGVSYCTGFNCSGTGHHEILQIIRQDGAEDTYVIMRGMSQAKAAAIVKILNAPEPS